METLEQRRERQRINYKKNAEKKKAQVKAYKIKNAELIKQKNKEYRKKRKEIDPFYKFKEHIRRMIIKAFNTKNLNKNNNTTEIIGCSLDYFLSHIEQQFESWMNWENRGSSTKPKTKWEIDHIIPLCTANTIDDIIKLNHYTNLRPLCSKENREKYTKI